MKLFLYIVTLILASVTAWAQKPVVHLSVNGKQFEVGDVVIFTVKSSVSGTVDIDVPAEFTMGSGISNGMEQEMDYNTGKSVTTYFFSQNGTFQEEGTFTIRAYVKNGKVLKSNSVTVKVVKHNGCSDAITKKTLSQPIFGTIEKNRTKIYEGEPLIVAGKTYSKLNISMLEGYQSFHVEGGAETFDLENSQQLMLARETFKGQNYLTFTYGKQLVFPNRVGKIAIKPFEMSLRYDDGGLFSENVTFRSLGSHVEVLPLPDGAPISFLGGVGKFSLSVECPEKKIDAKEVFPVIITVSGAGNLHAINKPTLDLPDGLVLYGDPEIKKDIKFGMNGTSGEIAYTFLVKASKGGKMQLPSIKFSYFDPSSKKYITLKSKKIELNSDQKEILAVADEQPNDATENTVISSHKKTVEMNKKSTPVRFFDSIWFWPTVLSPFALAFLFVFFKRKADSTESISCAPTVDWKAKKSELQAQLYQLSTLKDEPLYSQMQRCMHAATVLICKNTEIPFSKISIVDALAANGIPTETIETVWKNCELGKYGFVELDHITEESILQVKAFVDSYVN